MSHNMGSFGDLAVREAILARANNGVAVVTRWKKAGATMTDLLRESTFEDGSHSAWLFYCPGCKQAHVFDARWEFDGNMAAPTFAPSLLTNGSTPQLGIRCHLFLRAGRIEFLSDCEHELAGTTVPMEPFRWDES